MQILQTAPLPIDFSVGDNLNRAGYRFNAPISTRLNATIARFDLNLTSKQTVFFRGNYQEDLFGGAPAFPTTPRPNFWVHPKGFASGHTWTVGSSLVNNLRVGLTRAALSAHGDNDGTAISFRDVYTPLLNTNTNSRTNPTWKITNDVSWVKGTHTLQLGGNVRIVRNNSVSRANSYDNALVNFQFYQGGGASLLNPLADTLASGFNLDYGRAAAQSSDVFRNTASIRSSIKAAKTCPSARRVIRNGRPTGKPKATAYVCAKSSRPTPAT